MAIGACGDDDGRSTAADQRAKAREASLKFTKCMRDNGVDMPDAQVAEGGGVVLRAGGPPGAGEEAVPEAKFRKAEEACRQHLADLKPPEMSPEKAKEFRERALAFSKCMRSNGVDMPDPEFGEGGGTSIKLGRETGIDPSSPRFQRAEKACRDKLGGPRGPGVGPAPAGEQAP